MNDIKVALVTGAASGMGRISSKRLAADGVHVAAVDVNTRATCTSVRRPCMLGLRSLELDRGSLGLLAVRRARNNFIHSFIQCRCSLTH